jgi:ABC-type antimicrobial peptide transport system permease subunit
MKPLSPILYSKRNKKKIFTSINAVMLAVSFLLILYSFTESIMVMEARNGLPVYEKAAVMMNYEQKLINKKIIKEIKGNENVDQVVPTIFNYSIRFKIPGANDRALAVPIRIKDRTYFMDKLGIKLVVGDLPREGQKEIALNKDIAKNRNIKLGDKVGDSIYKFDNLPGEYTVTGLLDSEDLISLLSVNDSIYPNYKDENHIMGIGFYAFAKDGRKAELDKYVSAFPQNEVIAKTQESVLKHFEKTSSALKVMDIIAILSIIVMVITVGSSKYAQYINRKEEFGLLNAMGYNKNQILAKTFKEVVTTNLIGFLLGIALGVGVSFFLDKSLWSPCGVTGVLFTNKGFVVSTFVPMFTILFSIIPINTLINKLDPIKMIEKN